MNVEVHKRYYLPTEPDPNWIADSAGRGWVIISGDKGIEYDGINRLAVVTARAKVFLLADTTSRTIEWAASLVMARHKIMRMAAENNGPFYCSVEKGKDDHVGTLRFLEGGGPIPKSAKMVEPQVAVPESASEKPKQEDELPKTGDLPFDTE